MNKKILVVLVIAAVIFVSGCIQSPGTNKPELKKFSSTSEINEFIKNNQAGYLDSLYGSRLKGIGTIVPTMVTEDSAAGGASPTPDYSATNVQVQGVDEADIVKTDGKYIYTVSGGKNLSIVEAWPANGAKLLSVIEVAQDGAIHEIFVNGDKLIVFGREYIDSDETGKSSNFVSEFWYPRQTSKAFVRVYDVSDRSNPVMEKEIMYNGDYFNSRMIGDWVYFVVNNQIWQDNVVLPMVEKCVDVKGGCSDVYYIDEPANSYMLTLVGALNVKSLETNTQTFMLPYTEQMFVSLENIYITHQKVISREENLGITRDLLLELLPTERNKINEIYNSNSSISGKELELFKLFSDKFAGSGMGENTALDKKIKELIPDLMKRFDKTKVYKISINGGKIEMVAEGEFPGKLLNQFSMDESNGNFRTATTTGNVWDKTSKNHVYVLDSNLNLVGKLEDLAPGEEIYSVRFMGNRGYVVTFKKVDPLFVIDLSDPINPKILGKLKIPGFSDYLHPYDENHIIGIGKDTVDASESDIRGRDLDFAWYQGVKIALFDVSDPENPIEKAKFVIGDRGTDSYALYDHKAFLFDKERNLLVIPVLLAELTEQQKSGEAWEYGDYKFQGAYVFKLTLDGGFELKGRVTHVQDPQSFLKSGYYYFGDGDSVKRSLFIGNIGEEVLYTISDKFIKANKLSDLSEISLVELPYQEPEVYWGPMV